MGSGPQPTGFELKITETLPQAKHSLKVVLVFDSLEEGIRT